MQDGNQWRSRMAAALVQQRPLSTVATAGWDGLLSNLASLPSTRGGLTATQTLFDSAMSQLGLGAAYDLGLLAAPQIPPSSLPQWIAVRRRFALFNQNLLLTPLQTADASTKRAGVVSCLNRAYYSTNSTTNNCLLIGSSAKGTATRPPRDVDLYFILPPDVYYRFQQYRSPQSALLQEVRGHLLTTNPTTQISGDRQVVAVDFETFSVEVAPAFALVGGGYWICDAKNGGTYAKTDPLAEVYQLEAADRACAGNLRPLIRMLKAWQANCNVPIKSFHLELLATEFLGQCAWRLRDWFFFDWITRDFFQFLVQRANGLVIVPGTFEVIWLGDAWLTRAESALSRARKACDWERDNYIESAGDAWRDIFGLDVPRVPW
jgi:hypothetical protein